MEESIIKELIQDYASMMGISLIGHDIDVIYGIYHEKKYLNDDMQEILLHALHCLQQERVESQVLLSI